ncbi:lytic transglycosylase domain-containing protein [Mycobacterium sp.]|uniref:lytic transglycosylase domain-containing protein n=1 Tax=Mycobacterium sp. TaxID=1785 RepID=UPI003C75551A
MHIGGGSARGALEWARQRVSRVAHTPVTALVLVVAPVVFAGAAAGAPRPAPVVHPPTQDANVMPLAAVAPNPGDISGPSVIQVSRPPSSFHVAAASLSAPPPAVVVNSPGALRIPSMALSAYRNAERMMSLAQPGCGVSWNLLAGIGRIESLHANNGATDARGTAVRPIYGPTLDGSLPGNEVILQSMAPNGRPTYARAMGPMQFLPGTWARYASDGDGDGKADPQNLFDSALAASRYLCSGGLNLRDQSQVLSSILRYNNSMPYARNVLGWAAAYTTGVIPVDLPAITGPIPPMGDAHLETGPEGLGPGLPINVLGLPMTDPMTQMQLVNFGSTDVANQMPGFFPPGMDPNQSAAASPGCPTLVCFGASAMPSVTPPSATPFGPPLPGMGPTNQWPGVMPGPAQAAPLPGPMPALPAPAPPAMPQPMLPWLPPPPAPVEPTPAPAPVLPPPSGPLPGPAA